MLNKVIELYKEVVKVGEVKNAQILNITQDNVMIQVTRSFRNLTTKENVQTVTQHLLQNKQQQQQQQLNDILTFPPIHLDNKVLLQRMNNTGRLKAEVLKAGNNNNNNNNNNNTNHQCDEYVTITDCHTSITTTYNLSSADKHGKVYTDSTFSCLEFSLDDSKLLYIAEEKQPKPSSYFNTTHT
ncbi:hypothetical protein Pmani_030844, partial [Petrolisthes manimaculis]